MLRRALVAEGVGSLVLAATVIGSGIMAQRLAGGNLAVALLANTAATVAVLATLIALFGPISGAHFNPAVSMVEALRGRLTLQQSIVYVIVQIAGCCLGALLAQDCPCECRRIHRVAAVRCAGWPSSWKVPVAGQTCATARCELVDLVALVHRERRRRRGDAVH
jgi:hypothetical protein